ncbi:hypothetical protein [Microvirga sp. G4-2]|uniref:hypothetical protein n=1 Tax=Microvirga sp. G4-2 TaxID=3434467 RepID=UPI0040450668
MNFSDHDRHTPNKLNNQAIRRIREAWANGANINDLAGEYGVSRPAIYYHVQDVERKVPVRMGCPPYFDHAKALELRLQGIPLGVVAYRMGVTRQSVWRVTKDALRAQAREMRHAA